MNIFCRAGGLRRAHEETWPFLRHDDLARRLSFQYGDAEARTRSREYRADVEAWRRLGRKA